MRMKTFVPALVMVAIGFLAAMPAQADGETTAPVPPAVVDEPQAEQPLPEPPATGEMVPMLPPSCDLYAYMPCSPVGRTIPCTFIFPWYVSSCVCTAEEEWLCP